MIRLSVVFAIGALLLFVVGEARGGSVLLAPTSSCPTSSPTQMFCLHNYARVKAGLRPLVRDSVFVQFAAAKRDRILVCGGQLTHYPCGDKVRYPPNVVKWGENLAIWYPSVRATFQAWLSSPGHRANILLSGASKYGAAFYGPSRMWVVQVGSTA